MRMIWPIVGVAAAGLGGLAFIWISNAIFEDRINSLRQALSAAQHRIGSSPNALPELMRAYAIRAGGRKNGPAMVHAFQSAELVIDSGKPPLTIKADQWTGTIVPGLVWRASGMMNRLPVTIVDSYVDGTGALEARLFGTIAVSAGSGVAYDKGELMRYLSELPVYPDAILNARGLSWRQIDANTVEVSARSMSGAAYLRFIFDTGGDIVKVEADDRPMTIAGGTVETPWIGTYGAYRAFGIYRIPTQGTVGWLLNGELQIYWKGELIAYDVIP